MKYFLYTLEILDGEHGYYSHGTVSAKTLASAVSQAGDSAKHWYEVDEWDRNSREKLHKKGDYPEYSFMYGQIICKVDSVQEVPKDHYEILKQYIY